MIGREHGVSRRDLLRFTGGASLAMLAAGCGVRTSGGGGATSSTHVGKIVIPKPKTQLPTQNVTFSWMDAYEICAYFEKSFFAAYRQAHPNITINANIGQPWNVVNEAIPLGFRNGNAPDVFALPQTVSGGQAVSQGWVAPLEDVIPDFEKWKASFPAGSFTPGVHVFNGKTYTWPTQSSRNWQVMLYCNSQYVKQAGEDPSSKPLTWSGFRTLCRKITQQGNGRYYGLLLPGGDPSNLGGVVGLFANLAGANDINWKTGSYAYDDGTWQAAIELLQAIHQDGSLFPGSTSLQPANERAQFPQRVAGMIFTGPWDITNWNLQDASFKFDVAAGPLPDHGKPVPMSVANAGTNFLWVNANSKLHAVAGDLLSYYASVAGQTHLIAGSQGAVTSMLPEANQRAQSLKKGLNPVAKREAELAQKWVRVAPSPEIRNPDVYQVNLEIKAVTPSLGQIAQGALTGQISDLKSALRTLTDASNAELDRAINAARAKGANVSRQDWEFPNWDPTKDYSSQDYKALH